jgi:hypothetical protein
MKRLNFLFICFSAVFQMCMHNGYHESPLSNTWLTDPSLIHLRITLNPQTNYSSNLIRVIVLDENEYYVQILNGGIRINNLAMPVVKDGYDLPIYQITHPSVMKVLPNTDYSFLITLSDSSIYSASIRTQEKYMTSPVIPDTHETIKNLTVRWSDFGFQGDLQLSISRGGYRIEYDVPDSSSGYCVLSSKYLRENVKDSVATFYFNSKIEGTIDRQFGSGCWIESVFYSPGKMIFLIQS